jgi:hypothetical protein
MSRTPYLVKRGHMFWWRRRKPVFTLRQSSGGTEDLSKRTHGTLSKAPGHFAVSLRTSVRWKPAGAPPA